MDHPDVHQEKGLQGFVRLLPWPKRIDVVQSFVAMVIGLADRINISVAAPILNERNGMGYGTDGLGAVWVLDSSFTPDDAGRLHRRSLSHDDIELRQAERSCR